MFLFPCEFLIGMNYLLNKENFSHRIACWNMKQLKLESLKYLNSAFFTVIKSVMQLGSLKVISYLMLKIINTTITTYELRNPHF